MTPRLVAVEGGNANEELGYRTCSQCGSSWWTLAEEDGTQPQFVVSTAGEVVGWTGDFFCGGCGAPMGVPRHLVEVDES